MKEVQSCYGKELQIFRELINYVNLFNSNIN